MFQKRNCRKKSERSVYIDDTEARQNHYLFSQMYKVKDTNTVVLYGFRTQFGGGKSTGFGLIYDSVNDAKRFEPKYRLIRVRSASTETKQNHDIDLACFCYISKGLPKRWNHPVSRSKKRKIGRRKSEELVVVLHDTKPRRLTSRDENQSQKLASAVCSTFSEPRYKNILFLDYIVRKRAMICEIHIFSISLYHHILFAFIREIFE